MIRHLVTALCLIAIPFVPAVLLVLQLDRWGLM